MLALYHDEEMKPVVICSDILVHVAYAVLAQPTLNFQCGYSVKDSCV
jgi:hypothetical protein